MAMPTFDKLTAWFVARGYAVLLPQRPGHGQTGGPYLEDEGICEFANYTRAGDATADSIAAAIDYMTKQPFIRPDGVVAVGNSAGGWGVVALASRNPPAVSAVISLAGGRGGHNGGRPLHNCAPNRLVSAAGDYGRTARVPSLWLYAEQRHLFPAGVVAPDGGRVRGRRRNGRVPPAAGGRQRRPYAGARFHRVGAVRRRVPQAIDGCSRPSRGLPRRTVPLLFRNCGRKSGIRLFLQLL